ncbi:MAG: TlpA family protein disulfide reductase [Pirellulales bacterium]|nr:TlpA family protein disulfide reductase [Pirellulales bacterium]
MLTAYRKAGSYADRATYVQHSVHRAEGVERDLPFCYMSLAFERPNRLRLAFEEAVEGSAANQGFNIVSNGAVVRAMAGGLQGQIQETAAPARLSLENFLPDPYLREVFQGRNVGDVFPQLAMVLNQTEEQLVFPGDQSPRLLEPKLLRGRRCYRVASHSPAGRRTLWIDSQTYLLHRMELPIDAQRRTLDPDGSYTQLAVWIDFEDASFNPVVDAAAFEMEPPPQARRVRRFVLPPPAAPPDELGKPLAKVQFAAADGQSVTLESLRGKTVLLDFWQADCPACKAHTPQLDALYRELADRQQFALYAVNADPPARASGQSPADVLRSWGGTMPVLRLDSSETLTQLQVAGTPTLLLIDAAGRLQYRLERQLQDAGQLKQTIERVLGGENIAASARAERRSLVEQYQRELDAVTIQETRIDLPLSETKIADRKSPEHLVAEQLWKTDSTTVANPGHLSVVNIGDGTSGRQEIRLLVLDGAQAVVELDEHGAIAARHEIPKEQPADAAAPLAALRSGFLRTGRDAAGNRYTVVAGVGSQKLQVFDAQGKPQLIFPKERNPGIADVQLAPIGDAGQLRLYVGYWGGVGIQGVALDGQRKWSERSLDQVVQIAVVPMTADPSQDAATPGDVNQPNPYELWCTSNRGSIHVLDSRGKPRREIEVPLRSIMYVAAADIDGDRQLDGCGIEPTTVGQYAAVGFNADGVVQWQFGLPPGEYASQVERAQPATLPDGREAWMIAAPDGTIFWLDREGRQLDRFAYGQPLSGLALTNSAAAAILWVSTPEHVAAYRLINN